MLRQAIRSWETSWMRFAGLSRFGRFACRMASWFAPEYLGGTYLADLTGRPFVHPTADVFHPGLMLEPGSYVGARVVVHRNPGGGPVTIGTGTRLMQESILETGQYGSITIGEHSFVHPRCQLISYLSPLEIGSNTMIAANCAFYTFNHGAEPGRPIRDQPAKSEGGIVIGDNVWLGFGVIVLDGVEIGDGAVIGAGSIVAKSIPANSIAVGSPAHVLRSR